LKKSGRLRLQKEDRSCQFRAVAVVVAVVVVFLRANFSNVDAVEIFLAPIVIMFFLHYGQRYAKAQVVFVAWSMGKRKKKKKQI